MPRKSRAKPRTRTRKSRTRKSRTRKSRTRKHNKSGGGSWTSGCTPLGSPWYMWGTPVSLCGGKKKTRRL